jgi:hypothetical protein
VRDPDYDDTSVRGLALPATLLDLMSADRWRHPGDDAMRRVMPWFDAPLIFLTSTRMMARESQSLDMFDDDERSSELFRTIRGNRAEHSVQLPWLDVEKACLIAVNRIPGDDVAIALDYRQGPADPMVVASDFWSDPAQYSWRTVTPTFSSFATQLGLTGDAPIRDFPAGQPGSRVYDWQFD